MDNTSSSAAAEKLKGLNESTFERIKKLVNENPLCNLIPIVRDYERSLKELEEEYETMARTSTEEKLKYLNESVSEWIKKHVNENPLYNLIPVFRDYERYFKELEEEHEAMARICTEEKLKCLNESVSEWINKHVNENPLYNLIPVIRDYEHYLKELEEERGTFTDIKTDSENKVDDIKSTVAMSSESTTNLSMFLSNRQSSPAAEPSTSFPLSSTALTSTPFTLATTSVATSTPALFSFGIGSTFSFNANVQKSVEEEDNEEEDNEEEDYEEEDNEEEDNEEEDNEEEDNEEDEDEPPKVVYNPTAEENSVLDQRCKIFFKKDSTFVDKGVGTLYVKPIENISKYQVIVRANTSLATVIINFILDESISTQMMGENNVIVVCIIPTPPDSKPTPVSILIRVKTSEEAKQLLETLNTYKK